MSSKLLKHQLLALRQLETTSEPADCRLKVKKKKTTKREAQRKSSGNRGQQKLAEEQLKSDPKTRLDEIRALRQQIKAAEKAQANKLKVRPRKLFRERP